MTIYKHVQLYYFSGTGNSATAGRRIAEIAAATGAAVSLVPIDRLGKPDLPQDEGKALIGFLFSTHGFTTPWLMMKFIFLFPKRKNTDVFFLNTRGGLKLFSWFTPGLSGTAILLPLAVMILKGFRAVGTLPLDMPSNWIHFHPGLTDRAVRAIADHCRGIVESFAHAVVNGKKVFKGFWTLPLDLALIPVSIGYLIVGRPLLGKFQFASLKCTMCGLCQKSCPADALKVHDHRMYWTFSCESCMRCMNFCPQQAIEYPHLFIVLVIAAMTYMHDLVFGMHRYFPSAALLKNELALTAIKFSLYYVLFFILYWIFFMLIRFKPFNMFFTYTSLTKYFRRYRAPNMKLADFKRLDF